jgi:hypothetical protein
MHRFRVGRISRAYCYLATPVARSRSVPSSMPQLTFSGGEITAVRRSGAAGPREPEIAATGPR